MNVSQIHVTRGGSVLTASTVTLATVRGLVKLDFRVLKTLMNVKQLGPVIQMQLPSTVLEFTSVTVSQDLPERIFMRVLTTITVRSPCQKWRYMKYSLDTIYAEIGFTLCLKMAWNTFLFGPRLRRTYFRLPAGGH